MLRPLCMGGFMALGLLSAAFPQNAKWTPETVLNHLKCLQELPILRGLELIVRLETDTTAEVAEEKTSSQEDCVNYCRRRNWPLPVSPQRCGRWYEEWLTYTESLALLSLLTDYYNLHYPGAALAEYEMPRFPWLVAFMMSGLWENYGSIHPEGPAGFWGLHPQRARVYGLQVEKDYDERFDIEKASRLLSQVVQDAGSRPDLLITALVLGPAAAQSLRDAATDSLRRQKLGEPYDVLVSLCLALEKMHARVLANLTPPLPPPWHGIQMKTVPLCLESVGRVLDIPQELLAYHNSHWRQRCVENMKAYVIFLPREAEPAFSHQLPLLRDISDSLIARREPALAYSDSAWLKPFLKTTEVRRYHTVRKGETLHTIARKYGLSKEDLRRLNKLRSDRITAGQKLFIRTFRTSTVVRPSSDQRFPIKDTQEKSVLEIKPPEASAPSAKVTGEKPPIWYTVKPGDTLGGIARRYGISVAGLKKANGLTSDLIRAGQKLRIP